MTTRRAVTYGGLFCLLAAWLASAASTTFQTVPPAVDKEQQLGTTGTSTDALAVQVQAHASRLRERLQSAPTPQLPHRNPFAFQDRTPPAIRPARRAEPRPSLEPPPPREPNLSLIGIAEDRAASGLTRTAIIADEAENLIMVTIGHTVLGRYRVEGIGSDAVELKNVETNAVRRLALR